MKINLEGLKSILQAQAWCRQLRPRQDCPDPEKIVALLRSKLSRKKAGRIIDHISSCQGCSEEFKFLVEVFRAEKTLIEELTGWLEGGASAASSGRIFPGIRGGVRRYWSWKTVSLAAALLVVVLIFSTVILRHPDKYRADSAGRVELIEPLGERISRSSPVFRWKSLSGSEFYTVGVFEENLKQVWKSDRITATQLILPAEVTLGLSLNKPYFWMVTAFADGEEVASSLGRFVLTE